MAKKKKELDKLSLDMIQCKKDGYGCHYGDWYAAQNRPVVIKKKDEIPEGYKACIRCGKLFKPNKFCNGKQIYCDIDCQRAAQRERSKAKRKEYYQNYMEKKREAQRRAEDGEKGSTEEN